MPSHRLHYDNNSTTAVTMKTLGLLGGMTYNATAIYYNMINKEIQQNLGGSSSASLLLQSFNHHDMQALFTTGRWDEAAAKFITAAKNLKAAGAESIMICCNIGHKVADQVERDSGLPLLHIVDPTGEIIKQKGLNTIGLIGTKPVMEDTFYVDRLQQKYGLNVIVPNEQHREKIQKMIFKELGRNIITQQSKELLLEAINEAVEKGAQGIVFACTELQFVVKPEDIDVPLWDTMEGHAMSAARWALSDS